MKRNKTSKKLQRISIKANMISITKDFFDIFNNTELQLKKKKKPKNCKSN